MLVVFSVDTMTKSKRGIGMLYRLLNRINHPADLHRLSSEELVELAEEIRHLIISTVERTGGTLGQTWA